MALVDSEFKPLAGPPSFQSVTRDIYTSTETFTLDKALGLLRGLSSVLSRLHSRKISHGDFYGHNTLFHRSSGACLLGDFGAATHYHETGHALEPIEVRAFGIMMEELLSRLDTPAPERLGQQLHEYNARMLQEQVNSRPNFNEICCFFETIKL